jgi:hypothetical protein
MDKLGGAKRLKSWAEFSAEVNNGRKPAIFHQFGKMGFCTAAGLSITPLSP